ncbi:putative RNA-binding protein [Oxobacter pfennigii]|uniref:Putative RNA-binding protein n=1 Tax=Oxobacter pfennigii TaxID=36849 RepID=A0A0P8WZA1_9CLOT|nr:CooT family nickel-binding protein [Oxobacter pfennigii]KPU43807.1 putative RNA-binding protein [Oxobacter pfennigii]
MCESNVYLIDENGRESLFFESVDRLIPQEDGLLLENIFGQKKLIKAKIKELALVRHKIILEK